MPESLRAKVLENVRSLPMMSASATKVLALLRDPNTDAARFERVIRYDPCLTGNILRLANSAYFGSPGKIGSIRQAVVLLGWKRVHQLVVASSVHATLENSVAGYELPKGHLWRHSLAVALASESLMSEVGSALPDEAFTAALLHDVGKLALADLVASKQGQILDQVTEGVLFEIAEKQVLGIDHAEASALLLQAWAFPQSLVYAVRWHHDPDSTSSPSVVLDLVHVADTLCLTMGIGSNDKGPRHTPAEGSLHRLRLATEHLAATASTIVDDMDDVAKALQLNAPQA